MLMLFFSLIITANCAIDQSLKGKMQGVISAIYAGYPGGWDQHIINLGGNADIKQGVIDKSQLDSIGSIYGLPEQVTSKLTAMKWAQNLVLESFSVQITMNQAHVQEYIGAAYSSGQNVVFATICGNAWGSIVPKYDVHRSCKKKWYRKKKCHNDYIQRGITDPELAVIIQTLRARGFGEVQNALNSNDSNIFLKVDSLNILHHGLLGELNLQEEELN